MVSFALFITSFVVCAVSLPVIRKLGLSRDVSNLPQRERWQRGPVSRYGGLAIYLAFMVGVVSSFWTTDGVFQTRWSMLVCCSLMFLVGLYDDLHPLSPHIKLIAQILISALAIGFGYTTDFFTPRVENEVVAQLPNILLTFLWLVGITNAFNLLDNMDGLAAGIALIASGILSYFFMSSGDFILTVFSLSLAGAIGGFLLNNFPPASIYMGDGGSLFIGFTLAILAITRQPQASNVLAVIGVPILLFLVPILDTTLVTVTRILRGQSPVRGGKDHTSHRLIAFGLSERQTVLALYGIALVSGMVAASLEAIRYWYSLVLAPILIISLAVLFAYLGGMKVLQPETDYPISRRFTRIMLDLTFRMRIMEVILDFFLISLAYYLSYLVGNGLRMNEILLDRFLSSLPVILISAYTLFFLLGIYRMVWRYTSLVDIMRLLFAALGSVVFAAGLFFIIEAIGIEIVENAANPSLLILALFAIFLFLCLTASRASFRVFEMLIPKKFAKEDIPVLIYGAGEEGIMLVDWMRIHAQNSYRPVGFIDDDPMLSGRWIHGLKVFGGMAHLESILTSNHITGIILVGNINSASTMKDLVLRCQPFNCWIKKARLEIETVDEDRHTNTA